MNPFEIYEHARENWEDDVILALASSLLDLYVQRS